MKPRINPRSGRGLAEFFLRSAASMRALVSPYPWAGMTTSFNRRYSQLLGTKMQRTAPHPRPWEGPLPFWATERDALSFFDVDREDRPGGTYSNLLGYKP